MIDSWVKEEEEETKAEGRSSDTEQLAGTMLTKLKRLPVADPA